MTWELFAAVNITLIIVYILAKDDGIDQERERNNNKTKRSNQ